MSTYEIIPETTIQQYDVKLDDPSVLTGVTEEECRRLCDTNTECEAFTFTPPFVGVCDSILVNYKGGICGLKVSNQVPTQYATGTTLYLKGKRRPYTLLWIFLAILGIAIFVLMARKK